MSKQYQNKAIDWENPFCNLKCRDCGHRAAAMFQTTPLCRDCFNSQATELKLMRKRERCQVLNNQHKMRKQEEL